MLRSPSGSAPPPRSSAAPDRAQKVWQRPGLLPHRRTGARSLVAAAGWLAARSREAAAHAAALMHLRPPPPPSPHRASGGPVGLMALPKCTGVPCKLAATAATPERGGDLCTQAGGAAWQQRVLQRPNSNSICDGWVPVPRSLQSALSRVQMASLPDASSAAPCGRASRPPTARSISTALCILPNACSPPVNEGR